MKHAKYIWVFAACTFLLNTTLTAQIFDEIFEENEGHFPSIVQQMERSIEEGLVSEKEIKHYMRWRISSAPYVTEDGTVSRDANLFQKELQSFRRNNPKQFNNARVANGHWTSAIPTVFNTNGPGNGRLNCVEHHPTDVNTLFVGAPAGGLWKTTDHGVTWSCLTDGYPSNGVSDIKFHPDNPNIIYALTGDSDAWDMRSTGLIVSYDGGLTWNETPLKWDAGQNTRAYDLLIDPTHPSTMYVGLNRGLIATNDNWNTIDTLLTRTTYDIVFRPGTTDRIFAATRSRIYQIDSSGSNMSIACLSEGDLASTGLPNPLDTFSRTALAVSPQNPDFLYVLFARDITGNGFKGLYLAQDGGQHFTLQSDTPNIVGAGTRNQTSYDLELTADPLDASTVYVGGVDVWKSESNGQTGTWVAAANAQGAPSVHADIHGFTWNGTRLYVVSDGGISYTDNDGDDWTSISDGLNIMQFYDIDVEGTSTPRIIGGTQDNGTSAWYLGDPSANRIFGNDGFETFFDPSDNTVYWSDQSNRFRSTTGGGNGEMISPESEGDVWDASFFIHPTDFDTIYNCFDGIYRSFDKGENWEFLDAGFDSLTIRAVAQGVNNPERLYVSNRLSVHWTSSLNASIVNWLDLTPFLPVTFSEFWFELGGMCVDPANANEMWFTCMNWNDTSKVYYTSDGGFTWTNLTANLPNVPVLCITYHPGSNNGVYIGTDIGVFYRDANMTQWQYFGNGLPNTPVTDLKVYDGYIYAGTYGRGIWRSLDRSACPSENLLTVANDPSPPNYTGIQEYRVSNAIESTRIITGGPGTNVKYQAGGSVTLKSGFEARINNLFEAKIGGCID